MSLMHCIKNLLLLSRLEYLTLQDEWVGQIFHDLAKKPRILGFVAEDLMLLYLQLV